MLSDLAGDSVPASTKRAPSCSRRSKDFSDGGRTGLSKTESYTDSLPIGPSGFSLGASEYFEVLSAINSARTLYIRVRNSYLSYDEFRDSRQIMPISQLGLAA